MHLQIGRYQEAAASAYTFFIYNPSHQAMKDNLEYYRAMPEMMPLYFEDLERKRYEVCQMINL